MRYSVFVGGVEVNDFLLKYHEAVSLASLEKITALLMFS